MFSKIFMRKNIVQKDWLGDFGASSLLSIIPVSRSFFTRLFIYGHVSLAKIDPGRTFLWSSGLLADTLCVGLVTGFNLTDLFCQSHIRIYRWNVLVVLFRSLLSPFVRFCRRFSEIDVYYRDISKLSESNHAPLVAKLFYEEYARNQSSLSQERTHEIFTAIATNASSYIVTMYRITLLHRYEHDLDETHRRR